MLSRRRSSLRETGRAKHQIAYLMQDRGQGDTAETLFRLALADLEASTERDSRWYFALPAVLRDWADLLSDLPERLERASHLLHRAKAIQAFHGLRLELAYSTATSARIALTEGRKQSDRPRGRCRQSLCAVRQLARVGRSA